MKKITLFLALFGALFSYGQSDTVTFQVDMNNYTGTFTTVNVNGTFNSWCGGCNPLTDADMDGVWEVALPLPSDTIEYKFTVDGWTAQESLTPGTPCTITNGGFTNRSLIVNGNIVLPVVCWNSCGACSNKAQIDLPITWDDTANVDYTVTDFGGNASSVVVDPTNSSNMVLQSDKSNTAQFWAGTTLSTPGGLATAIPFTSTNTLMTIDVWSPDSGIMVRVKAEDASDPTKSVETETMTTVAGGWQNMTFDFSNEAAGTAPLDTSYTFDKLSIFYNYGVDGATAGAKTYYCDNVVFGAGGPPAGTYNVTFRVDMNNYTGSFTTPEVNGEFNGWCGNCAPLADPDMDGIWELTIPVSNDSIEYKFSYDNWAGQEALQPGMPCTKTTGNFTNRFMHVTKDTILPAVCWESCVDCAGSPMMVNVTFRVDLSEYTGSYTEVNLNGTFNNWCGSCTQMTSPNNDSIYEVTVLVPADTIEYKFTLDGWTTDEQLTQGDFCTLTTVDGGNTFTNRFLVPTADTTMPAVCWESCLTCNSIGIDEDSWANNLTISPNPSTGLIHVNSEFNTMSDLDIKVTDIQGRVIFQDEVTTDRLDQTIDLQSVANGMYMIHLSSELGSVTEKVLITH